MDSEWLKVHYFLLWPIPLFRCKLLAQNRKRGSSSYIVRDVHFVRERETEIDGSDVILVTAEIGDEFGAFMKLGLSFAFFHAKNLHLRLTSP